MKAPCTHACMREVPLPPGRDALVIRRCQLQTLIGSGEWVESHVCTVTRVYSYTCIQPGPLPSSARRSCPRPCPRTGRDGG